MEQDTATKTDTELRSTSDPAGAGAARTSTATVIRSSGTTFESLAVAGLVLGVFAVVIAVFAVGLAARAVSEASGSGGEGGGGGGTAPATLEITLADFSLDPDVAEISTGGTITLQNEGATQHDLVVEDVQSDMIEPGAAGEFTIDGLAVGDYVMYCSIPGHREAGMEGTIAVK